MLLLIIIVSSNELAEYDFCKELSTSATTSKIFTTRVQVKRQGAKEEGIRTGQ